MTIKDLVNELLKRPMQTRVYISDSKTGNIINPIIKDSKDDQTDTEYLEIQ